MYKDQINKIRYLNYNINMLNDDNKNTRKVNEFRLNKIVLNSESGIHIQNIKIKN